MNPYVFVLRAVEIIVLMIGWYTYRNLPNSFKIIVYYISFSAIAALVSKLFSGLFGNNYIFFHFYTPLELIIMIITIMLIIESKIFKSVAIFILIPYLIFWVISKFTFESLNQIDNVTSAVTNTIILIFAVYGILKISLSSFGSILYDPRLISLFGILLYFGGSLVVFTLSNLIFLKGNNDAILLWKIHNIVNISMNITFAYSFYLYEWKPDKINAL